MRGVRRTHRAPRKLGGLTHPCVGAATVLLLVNDHLLKGSEILPAAVTGKLSDFAGMVVAPVVLHAILTRAFRLKSRPAGVVSLSLVTGWFVAANLVPAVAGFTEEIGHSLGLTWRFWADPTDLVALSVLPVTWALMTPTDQRGGSGRTRAAGTTTERFALGLSLAACVASPQPPDPGWNTRAWVVNDTDERIEVRLRWITASVDCTAARSRPADLLPRTIFDAGQTFALDPGETLPLNRDNITGEGFDGADDFTVPTHAGTCEAILFGVDGLMEEQLIFWEGLSEEFIPAQLGGGDDDWVREGGLRLRGGGESALQLEAARQYTVSAPAETYSGGAACRDYGTTTGFGWSDIPYWLHTEVRLRDVRETLDGCVSFRLREFTANTTHGPFFLCIPPQDFPFESLGIVRVTATDRTLRMVRDLVLEDGTVWRTGELLVARGVAELNEGPFALDLVQTESECQGLRTSCGGFRVPAVGGLILDDGERFVAPGDAVERVASDGRRARLRVGRSERTLVAHPACGAEGATLGPRLDALVVYGEEPR